MHTNILNNLISNLHGIKILSDKNSIPNALLLYGDDCDYLLSLAKEFIIYLYRRCDNIPPLPSEQCKDIDVFQHPDIKWVFPIIHNNVNDSCDKYLYLFAKYVNSSIFSNKSSWQKIHTTGNKQMTINSIDVVNLNLFLSLPLVFGTYKIVVIWLPELMNNTTANTLLKLIEEPTSTNKALFILLSEDIYAVLPTIKSRCLNVFIKNFSFNSHDDDNIIADKNNYIIKESSNNIVDDKKKEDDRYYSEFIDFLRICYKFDMTKIFDFIEWIHNIGKEEIIYFFLVGIDIMRDILYRHCGIKTYCIVEKQFDDTLQKLSQALDFVKIKNITNILTSGINDIKKNVNTKILVFNIIKNIHTYF